MEEYQKLNEELLKEVSGGDEGLLPAEGQTCPLCKSTNIDYYLNTSGKQVNVCRRCYVQWIPEQLLRRRGHDH